MAMSASSFLSSSTLCTKERSPVTTKLFGTRWAVRNQKFSNHDCIKRGFLQSMVRTNSSRVYPRLQASLSTGGAAITTEKLNQEFGCLGVTVVNGEGNLPKIVLSSSVGSEVEIYTFGGCVTSWKTSKGKDLLFVRPDAVFNGQKPISGGIPHCFPQFGPGPMQQHGFARNMTWSVVSSENSEGNPTIVLELKDNPYTHSMWDFNFLATYKVALNSDSLSTELLIKNTDNKPFSFTAALHTYFHASVTGALVKGLKGCKTLNKFPDPQNPIEGLEEREFVNFPGFVDCIYNDAPNKLQLENGLGATITLENRNWADAVLWNPHMTMEACYRDFVCVENAKIGKVELQSGQTWTGQQFLSSR